MFAWSGFTNNNSTTIQTLLYKHSYTQMLIFIDVVADCVTRRYYSAAAHYWALSSGNNDDDDDKVVLIDVISYLLYSIQWFLIFVNCKNIYCHLHPDEVTYTVWYTYITMATTLFAGWLTQLWGLFAKTSLFSTIKNHFHGSLSVLFNSVNCYCINVRLFGPFIIVLIKRLPFSPIKSFCLVLAIIIMADYSHICHNYRDVEIKSCGTARWLLYTAILHY